MSGGGGASAPAPTEEERALQSEQTALLREQRETTQRMVEQQELLAPHLYEQAGLKPKLDASGKIIGFEKLPDDPSEVAFKQLQTQTLENALAKANDPQNKEIESLLQTRTLDALKGNLPVDPGLERGLKEGRGTLEEMLRSNIGSGYATSTPGISALADFDKRAEELRYGARTGALTLGEQLQGARSTRASTDSMLGLPGMELESRLRSSSLGSTMGVSSMPGMGAAALGNTAGAFGGALDWYGKQRDAHLRASQTNAGGSDGSGWGQAAGTGLAAWGTYAAVTGAMF